MPAYPTHLYLWCRLQICGNVKKKNLYNNVCSLKKNRWAGAKYIAYVAFATTRVTNGEGGSLLHEHSPRVAGHQVQEKLVPHHWSFGPFYVDHNSTAAPQLIKMTMSPQDHLLRKPILWLRRLYTYLSGGLCLQTQTLFCSPYTAGIPHFWMCEYWLFPPHTVCPLAGSTSL